MSKGTLQNHNSEDVTTRKVVHIRKTVHQVEVGLDNEESEARRGAEDPDLQKLSDAAEQRQQKEAEDAAAQAAKIHFVQQGSGGSRTSFVDATPEEIPRNQEQPVIIAKRCNGRKGTGFVKKQEMPILDDEDEEDE